MNVYRITTYGDNFNTYKFNLELILSKKQVVRTRDVSRLITHSTILNFCNKYQYTPKSVFRGDVPEYTATLLKSFPKVRVPIYYTDIIFLSKDKIDFILDHFLLYLEKESAI